MYKHKLSLLLCGLLCSTTLLSACSGDKVLPKGTRVAVLDQTTIVKPDVAKSADKIQIAKEISNTTWLQSDMNAQHVMPNAKTGFDFVKQWKADFGQGHSKREFLISKPLIKEHVVYTLDADAELRAFNLKDGEKLWSVELMPSNRRVSDTAIKGAGLALEGNEIYVTTGFGVVVAVSAKDGSKLWEQDIHAPLRIAPTVAGNKVFVQSVDNKFFALDKSNGEVLWDYDIAMEETTMVGGAVAAYSAKADVVITGFSNGEIQAFGAAYGSPLWSDFLVANRQAYSSTFLHTIKASPVIDEQTVYVLGSGNVLAALDLYSGTRKWEKEIGGQQTPFVSGNTLFVVSNNNELIALDKTNGDVLWSKAIDLKGKASEVIVYAPVVLNSRVVVSLSNGIVHAFDPKTGNLLNTVDLDEKLNSAPIAAGGYIIFTTSNAKLLAYK